MDRSDRIYRQKHLRKTLKPSIRRDLGVPPQSPAQQRISTRPAGFNGRLQPPGRRSGDRDRALPEHLAPLPDHGDQPGRGAHRSTAGQGATPEARAMAQGYTPSGIAAIVRPGERIGKTSRASNVKSQSVAFGISRPTRTPTAAGSPQGGETADRGLDCHAPQSPGTGSRQPVAPNSHVRRCA